MTKAVVREEVEKVDGVSRSWFEWTFEPGGRQIKTLVVEVDWDTDPNSPDHRPFMLDAIESAVKETFAEKTTMAVDRLRVVPKV
jgi:hypothetical protein